MARPSLRALCLPHEGQLAAPLGLRPFPEVPLAEYSAGPLAGVSAPRTAVPPPPVDSSPPRAPGPGCLCSLTGPRPDLRSAAKGAPAGFAKGLNVVLPLGL